MIGVDIARSFTAGLVATVNPCGFPMLPAYLSWFIGTDADDQDISGRVLRAVASALAVALGFLAVFAGLGVPINAGMSSIYRWMPWFTIVIGAVLVALGIAMLGGFRLKIVLPRLDRGGRSRRFGSMVLFGASYAVASLSCTLPVFLSVVVGTTRRADTKAGALAFVVFAAGMVLVLLTLSLAIALAKDSMVLWMRSLVRFADRAAAALLVLVGGYLVYYGIYAANPSNNSASNPIGVVEGWSSNASSWFESNRSWVAVLFTAFVVIGTTWAVSESRRLNRR